MFYILWVDIAKWQIKIEFHKIEGYVVGGIGIDGGIEGTAEESPSAPDDTAGVKLLSLDRPSTSTSTSASTGGKDGGGDIAVVDDSTPVDGTVVTFLSTGVIQIGDNDCDKTTDDSSHQVLLLTGDGKSSTPAYGLAPTSYPNIFSTSQST